MENGLSLKWENPKGKSSTRTSSLKTLKHGHVGTFQGAFTFSRRCPSTQFLIVVLLIRSFYPTLGMLHKCSKRRTSTPKLHVLQSYNNRIVCGSAQYKRLFQFSRKCFSPTFVTRALYSLVLSSTAVTIMLVKRSTIVSCSPSNINLETTNTQSCENTLNFEGAKHVSNGAIANVSLSNARCIFRTFEQKDKILVEGLFYTCQLVSYIMETS